MVEGHLKVGVHGLNQRQFVVDGPFCAEDGVPDIRLNVNHVDRHGEFGEVFLGLSEGQVQRWLNRIRAGWRQRQRRNLDEVGQVALAAIASGCNHSDLVTGALEVFLLQDKAGLNATERVRVVVRKEEDMHLF